MGRMMALGEGRNFAVQHLEKEGSMELIYLVLGDGLGKSVWRETEKDV